jgi:ribonuclease HI
MVSDREVFRAITDALDYRKIAASTGLTESQIRDFLLRTEKRFWRAEVKDKGGFDKLVINVDGASRGNPGPAAAGVLIRDADGAEIDSFGRLLGETTNNAAEYMALILAIERASEFGAKSVKILTDSEILKKQLSGEYRVKSPHLVILHGKAEKALASFKKWEVELVPRAQNAEADALANIALDKAKAAAKKGGNA